MNESCLSACHRRFGDLSGSCRLHYHRTSGTELSAIASGSIRFVYSWDAVVHFDREVVRAYVAEFARVLRPGGTGFIRHSHHGAVAPGSDWRDNPHWRSDLTRDDFRAFCHAVGLEVTAQEPLPWSGVEDCLSRFRKPGA